MKTQLLILLAFFGTVSVNAQTTYNLDWFAGMGSNVDLTIVSGDTVIWTWTSPNHTVESVPGSSVETFSSPFMVDVGSTYSYTFTVVGDNAYFCGVHGAASMSGTISVTENLGVDENELNHFRMIANPVKDVLVIELPQNVTNGQLTVNDVLGKTVLIQKFNNNQAINVNVSSLNLGIYLITLESGDKKQTQRFIKN